jgi:predicted SprT family Zn-dependent metalloprotease
MNYFNYLDNYQDLNKYLSRHFNIPMVKINFTGINVGLGLYFCSTRSIRIAEKARLWVFTHEYAHYLDHMKNGKRKNPHSEIFYWHLRAVIKNIEPIGYPWHKEYKQLQRWAKRDKLLWIYEDTDND